MTAEHDKARAWRERLGLSYDQLADLSGYAAVTIRCYEKGLTPPRTRKHVAGEAQTAEKRQIPWPNWMRYKLVCAAVEAQITSGKKFEW